MVTRMLAGAATMLVACGAPLSAQETSPWSLSVDLMQSLKGSQPGSVFRGATRGIGESALSIRASTTLARMGPIRLQYVAQVLPLVRITGAEGATQLQGRLTPIYVLGDNKSAYGIGAVPFGLDLAAALGPRVRVSGGAGIGIAAFVRNVPVAASRQRAFTAEWGARVDIDVTRRRALTVGYRWKHTSNGMTAIENPGFDSRLIVVGLQQTVRIPR